jgi:predicted aspartyl protease
MHIEARINGKTTRGMVDSGATHNFIDPEEVRPEAARTDEAREGGCPFPE